MTQLSDTQALILSAAAQRPERIALPLPESLRGGAAAKVVGAMIAKGLLQEVDADLRKGETVWRETGDGHGVTLIATDAGLAVIGVEPDVEVDWWQRPAVVGERYLLCSDGLHQDLHRQAKRLMESHFGQSQRDDEGVIGSK